MGEARGTITQEELEKYGEANIMLLSNTRDLSSGGIVSGSGTYSWTFRWTSVGFTGVEWTQSAAYYYGNLVAEWASESEETLRSHLSGMDGYRIASWMNSNVPYLQDTGCFECVEA